MPDIAHTGKGQKGNGYRVNTPSVTRSNTTQPSLTLSTHWPSLDVSHCRLTDLRSLLSCEGCVSCCQNLKFARAWLHPLWALPWCQHRMQTSLKGHFISNVWMLPLDHFRFGWKNSRKNFPILNKKISYFTSQLLMNTFATNLRPVFWELLWDCCI